MPSFVANMWKKIIPLFEQIKHHPFHCSMVKGDLDIAYFHNFLHQDALYLKHTSRITKELSRHSSFSSIFLEISYCFDQFESKIHNSYLKNEPSHSCSHTMDKVCQNYVTHLQKAADSSPKIGLAALLPCFLIYKELGYYAKHTIKSSNPYELWIHSYSSPRFCEITDRMITCIDESMINPNGDDDMNINEKMQTAFVISAYHEKQFWDKACEMELSNKKTLEVLTKKFDTLLTKKILSPSLTF